jgi:hypothetical protein
MDESSALRISGLATFVAGGLWAWRWEAVRAFLYDRGSKLIEPPFGDEIGHWGVPFLMVALGTFLLWKSRHPARFRGGLSAPKPDEYEYVSLYKAASKAYGATRNTALSRAAEREVEEPEAEKKGPLTWYAFYFLAVSHTPIYGNLKLSPRRELADLQHFDFEMNGNEIIATENSGSKVWENLCIKRNDLELALEHLHNTTRPHSRSELCQEPASSG